MAYNNNTDWENEKKYLNNLLNSGNAGEQAWAKKQLGIIGQQTGITDPHMSLYDGPTASTGTSETSNPYNENTDWGNETEYLNNLIINGNAGQRAWANNQMNILNDTMVLYDQPSTLPTPSLTRNPASGNPTTGNPTTGNPTTGNPTTDTPTTETPIMGNVAYNKDTDYQALINEAVARGDYQTAAILEYMRNQKIIGEGLDEETTNLYSQYLGGNQNTTNDSSASDILSWNDNYNTENAQPSYTSEYDPTIDHMLSEILTREDFSYNVENDPLYQQYKTMYNREGDRAMRDTLAEAAATAGGMNSYAITAAQQANNYYNSQLNDRIPELYQLAYEMYLQDKESMVQDLGLLVDMDDRQYNRYRDTMNDWRNDKDFAYGVFKDAISQGNWEQTFDYNQSVDDRDYNFMVDSADKEWTDSDKAAAKEDVWKLIGLGVTPSADLIAKAGMSQTDVDLAVAAVKGGSNNDNNNNNNNNNNNGYTPKGDDTPDDTPIIEGNNPVTTGVTEEIKAKCANITNNNELANYIDGLVASNSISPEDGDKLYAQYVDDNEKYIANEDGTNSNTHSYGDMVKSTNGWEVIDNGGINWFWGVDNNAIVKAPNGEQISLDNLVDKLVSEGMDKKAAKAAVKALQKNLQIVG